MSEMTPEKTREMNRMAELRAYGILDTPNEDAFDAIVKRTAKALGTPMALISFVDENRQWFKARHGLEASETPRTISFCTHAIQGPEVFVVADAERDERFVDNPLVTGDPNIRFYAGAPLKSPNGRRIGTLCVLDSRARSGLSAEARLQLQELAEDVMRAVEARKPAPKG
jgi:GAF domain-containing protein